MNVQKSEQFWPAPDGGRNQTVVSGGKEIGIYLCRVKMSKNAGKGNDRVCETCGNDGVEIIPLHHTVLEKFLAKGKDREI